MHIMAVSGLHVGMISLGLYSCLFPARETKDFKGCHHNHGTLGLCLYHRHVTVGTAGHHNVHLSAGRR